MAGDDVAQARAHTLVWIKTAGERAAAAIAGDSLFGVRNLAGADTDK